MLGRFQNAGSKSSLQSRTCFPYEIENIWDGSCHLSFIDMCDKKYYAAKTEQQQWWILQITGMSCPRHRLSLVAKSRQCLQLFSSSSPAYLREWIQSDVALRYIFARRLDLWMSIHGSLWLQMRPLSGSCPIHSNLCKSYQIQLSPFPPLVFDLLWTESSSTIGGLPLVRAFFYNRPGVSSILHQVQCVFAKGLQASFFQISQIRPTARFSGPGCYQLPKIVAGTCWWLSWLCAPCTVCTARDLWMRARRAPTSRPAEATSTSNSIFGENPYEITNFKLFAVHISICEFCEWSYAHTFNTKTPKQPPSPQNLPQGSLFPSYSSLWFECSCLTPINNSPLLRFLAPYHSLGQGLMIIIA